MGRLKVIAAIAVVATGLTACTPPPPAPRPCGTIVREALPAGADNSPVVSPDGRSVVYRQGSTLRVITLATGADRPLFTEPAGRPLYGLQYSSDSTRVGVRSAEPTGHVRYGWIITVATSTVTELDWSTIDWPDFTFEQGFSGDLSVFVTHRFNTDQFRVIPSDGSAVRFVTLAAGGVVLDDDASTIAGGATALHDGLTLTNPGPGDVFALSRDGSRAVVSSPAGTAFWFLDTGVVQPITLPGGAASEQLFGKFTDNGRVFAGHATIDGVAGMWRVDRTTGEASAIPPINDGITSVSNDGRVITSDVPAIFRCTG